MSTLDAMKRGLTVLLAAGGLAGPVAVIIYTSSRASADDLDQLKAKHAVLQQAHDDLASKVDRDRAEMLRRLDHIVDLLEEPLRAHR